VFSQQKKGISEKKKWDVCLTQLSFLSIEDRKELQLQFTYSKRTELRKVKHSSKEDFSILVIFSRTQVELYNIVFAIPFISFCC